MSAENLHRNIEPEDIGKIAASERGKACEKLAVLGPREPVGTDVVNWPEFLKECDLVISLKSPLHRCTEHLEAFENLASLCLRGNRLDEKDAARLFRLETDLLECLDLDNNELGDGSVVEITKFKTLKRLHLGQNAISNKGLEDLENLEELEQLYLANNDISDKGFKWIESLSTCRKLKILDISSNKIGDGSLEKILDLKSLKVIDLSNNRISIKSKPTLEKLIKTARIIIDKNDIDPDEGDRIYKERVNNLLKGESSYICKENYRKVIDAELEHILNPDEFAGGQRDRLIGLALSGGGVRSASFSMGVLQALACKDHLKHIHYMSTVSGGGYIGSSLSWFIGKNPADENDPKKPGFDTSKERFPIGSKNRSFLDVYETNEENRDRNGERPPQVQILDHIRQHGSYLTPKGGWDVFKLLAMVSRAMIPSFFIYFGLLLLPLALIAYLLAVPPVTDEDPFCWATTPDGGETVICSPSAGDDDASAEVTQPSSSEVTQPSSTEVAQPSLIGTGERLQTRVSDLLARHGALRLTIGVFCVLAATALIAAFSSGLSEARHDTSEKEKEWSSEFSRWWRDFGIGLFISTFFLFLAVLYLFPWGDRAMPIVLFAMLTGILSKRLITFPVILFLLSLPVIIFYDGIDLVENYYFIFMSFCVALIVIAFYYCKTINDRQNHILNTGLILLFSFLAFTFVHLPDLLIDNGWWDIEKTHRSPMLWNPSPSLAFSAVLAVITFMTAASLWSLDFHEKKRLAKERQKRKCQKNDDGDQASGDGSVLRESYDDRKELAKPGAGLLIAIVVLLTLACLKPIYLWSFGEFLGPSLTLVGIAAYFSKIFIEVRNIKLKYADLEGLLIGIASVGSVIGLLLLAFAICDLLYGSSLLSVEGNDRDSRQPHWIPIVTVAAIAVATYFLARSVNVNFVGLHRFYRDRLMETFMPQIQVSDDKNDGEPGKDDERTSADQFFVHELRNVTSGRQRRAPYHIINTNVVLINARDPRFRGRGGANFMISPLYSGSDATGWRSTESWRVRAGNMTLATAMAVSGAAINPRTGPSGRGPMRKAFASFLMTLFNARLGLWVHNPKVKPVDDKDKDKGFLSDPMTSPNFIKP